jgi:hypothetical protein
MSENNSSEKRPAIDLQPESSLEAILKAVSSLRYGVVQIVIQDGRIVQIEKTERIRLP